MTDQGPRIIDAKYKFVRKQGRPGFTASWTDDEYERWRAQPFLKRWRPSMNWEGVWITTAFGAFIAVAQLLRYR